MLEYLGTTKLLPTFSNKTGWFSANTIASLRVMALKALPERIHRFVSLPDSIIWKDPTPHESAAIVAPATAASTSTSTSTTTATPFAATGVAQSTARVYDPSGVAMLLREAQLDINEDAAQLGFDDQSTGLFVICNRTLNTLRTFLYASAEASDPTTVLADATSAVGEVNRDEVLTADGIYLGKVLAWHRRYAAVLKGMPFMGFAEHEKYIESLKPAAAKAKKAPTTSKSKPVSFQDSTASASSMAAASTSQAQPSGGLYTRVLGGNPVEAFSFFNTDENYSHSDSDSDSGSDAY